MEIITHSLATLNPFAVLASAATILIVGTLWFSQTFFGRAWIRLSGIRPGDRRPVDQRRGLIVGALTALITACLLGLIAQHGEHQPHNVAMMVGFIWLFIMLTQLNAFVWRHEPFALFLLVTTRSLAMLMAGGLVFCLWS